MSELKATRWGSLCAGGYFAAAAVYIGNAAALSAARDRDPLLTAAMGGFPVVCGVMGGLVLAEKRWAARLAVVVAGGFSAIHLVGLAYLFLIVPASTPALTRSLQWQLGVAFLVLWLTNLGFAFGLAKCVGRQ
jgi:hypothetical protein